MKQYLFFALAALFISYAPMWAKPYVEIFNSKAHDVPFSVEKKIEDGIVIYHASLPAFSDDQILTLGVVWPIPAVSCDGRTLHLSRSAIASDKNSVLSLVIPKGDGCRDFQIEFRKTKGYFLYGVIGGAPFISGLETATSYKRIVDFFYGDLRLLLLVVVLVYIVLLALSGTQLTVGARDLMPIERYSIPWGLFLLTSAGVFEMLLPWEAVRSEIPRLNSYFSAIAHLGPGIDYIARRIRRKPPSVISVFLIFSGLLFVPERMLAFLSIGVPVGIFALASSIGAEYVGPYRYYSILLLVNFLKLAGGMRIDPALLPHIHVVSVYIGFVMGNGLFRKILAIGKISDFISWANDHRISKYEYSELKGVLQKTLEITSATKVQLVASIGGILELHEVKKGRTGQLEVSVTPLKQLPPVFAAAVTASSAFYLIDESSSKATNLRKGVPSSEKGSFSVLPLYVPGVSVAAIYLNGCFEKNEPEEQVFHKKICDLVSRHLEIFIDGVNTMQIAKGNHDLVEIVRHFSEAGMERSTESVISDSFSQFLTALGCEGVLFAYNAKNEVYEPKTHYGLNEVNSVLASDLFVKVNDANEHGPFILGVRNRKIICVNDTSLIEDVLKGRTSAYLKSCGSRSIAILPVSGARDINSTETSVRYVLMFQSKKENIFSGVTENFLSRYAGVIERYLSLKDAEEAKSIHKAALKEFAPSDVAELFISGRDTRISSVGYLGCLDIIGSSSLLRDFGDQWFRKLANDLMTDLSKFPGVKVASMNWDAYYFSSDELNSLLDLYGRCNSLLSSYVDRDGNKHELKFRLCISHGDTSQDFCEANGFKRWTVVGAAMASVCKFEQRVKSEGPGVFLDELAYAAGSPVVPLREVTSSGGGIYFVAAEKIGVHAA